MPTRATQTRPQSLLILHLHGEKLRRDGLFLGDATQATSFLSSVLVGSEVTCAEVNDETELERQLDELATAGRYDVVIAIGHSNEAGIRVGHHDFLSWREFGKRLRCVKPRRLLLVACEAGRSGPADALFETNRDLRRIYGCPTNASKPFGEALLLAAPLVLANRRPTPRRVRQLQLAFLAISGLQLREWLRTKDHLSADGRLHDEIAIAAAPALRKVHDAVTRLLGRR